MTFMENHNLNLTATLSPSSTQNEPEVTTEEVMQTNNNVVTEAVGVDAGSDTGGKSEAGGSGQGVKRGRGRPRKNGIGGNQLALVSSPPPPLAIQDCGSDGKRGRGRPRGSGKLQILASIGGFVAETAGGNLTPHVLTVNPGEDLGDRIFAFFQKGPRAVCVLSATGIVSNVILRQPGASGGILKFEGRFEILTLAGSSTYAIGVAGGANRRNGMLTVTLAQPDGKVFGGVVEGSLIAATPIQLILGTFKQSISNQIKRRYSAISTTPNMPTDQDSARDHHSKVPKLLTEGESSCPSPLSAIRLITATANGVTENVIPETANEVSDNVTAAEHSDSDPVRGIDLDSEALLDEPVIDQRTSTDVDANASSSTVPQM